MTPDAPQVPGEAPSASPGLLRRVFLRAQDGRLRAGWRYLLFLTTLTLAMLLVSAVRMVVPFPRLRDADGVVIPVALLVRGVLTMTVALGTTALLLRFVEKRPLSTVGLPVRRPWLGGIGFGLLLGAASVVLHVAVLAATGGASVGWTGQSASDLVWRWVPTVVGLALVSASEELMLRGYGLQLLSEAGGRWLAALLTGVLFGAMHASNPGANTLGIVNTAATAVLLAWLIMRTGSLWIGCAYHAGWNLAGAMVLGMRLSGIDHPAGLLTTRLTGPEWLTGGAYGFEGSVLIGLVELVVLGVAVVVAPRLPGHPELRRYFGAPHTRSADEGAPGGSSGTDQSDPR